MTPVRIQRQRTKGWRMPPDAVYVGRPSRWGNPFPVEGEWIEMVGRALGFLGAAFWTQGMAVALYRWWVTGVPVRSRNARSENYHPRVQITEGTKGGAIWVPDNGMVPLPPKPTGPDIESLRGKTLVCWCPLDQPCHADVLLELVA